MNESGTKLPNLVPCESCGVTTEPFHKEGCKADPFGRLHRTEATIDAATARNVHARERWAVYIELVNSSGEPTGDSYTEYFSSEQDARAHFEGLIL